MNDTAGSAGLAPAPSAAPDVAAASRAARPSCGRSGCWFPTSCATAAGRAAALVALLVAAVTTLVVPVAVRRMIDFGFDAERIGLIDQYFGVMIAVVGGARAGERARATTS